MYCQGSRNLSVDNVNGDLTALRLCLVIVTVFYFQKLVFGNMKKKTNFLYFWIKKHVWLVKIKKKKLKKRKY